MRPQAAHTFVKQMSTQKNIIFLVKRCKMTHNLGVVETYNEKYDIWATGTSKRPHDGHTSVTTVNSKKGTDIFSANKYQ